MSTEAWIFMVGLRVFDVGALIVWLVWFFKLRDDDPDEDEPGGEGGGGDEPVVTPPVPAGGDGCEDRPRVRRPWRARRRERRPSQPRRVHEYR